MKLSISGVYCILFTLFLANTNVLAQDYTYEEYTQNIPNKNLHLTNEFLCQGLINEINEIGDKGQVIRNFLSAAKSNKNKQEEDSLLREMIKVDSTNHLRLKNIIADYSYPTRYNAGYAMDKIMLLIIHSDEHDNDVFLEKYYDLALKGEVDWNLPERIETNLIWRFKRDGYNFLKLIQLTTDQNLEITDKNYFELFALSKLLLTNPNIKVELFPTSNLKCSSADKEKLLDQIGDFLLSHQLDKDRFVLNPDKIIEDKYYNGIPLFAMRMVFAK